MSKSLYYHTGRLIGLIDEAARAGGEPLTATKITLLFQQPFVEWPRYIKLIQAEKWSNNRMGNITEEIDGPETPRVMTSQQLGEAQLGYHAEKDAIKRGQYFWRARQRSNLSQEDFAKEIGASRAAVRDWETHRRDCPKPVLELVNLKWPHKK